MVNIQNCRWRPRRRRTITLDFNAPSPLYSGERVGVRGRGRRAKTPCTHVGCCPPSPPTPLPRVQGRGEQAVRLFRKVILRQILTVTSVFVFAISRRIAGV